MSIKHENLHSFKEGVILLCQSILETRRILRLHGSALFKIPLIFRAYPECPESCSVKNLLNYLDTRLTRSSDPALFISTTKPYKSVSRDTIARWIKNTKDANIDTGLFTAYTCRSASTSKAKLAGLNIKTILNSANWTKDNIFKRYYFKEIQENYQPDHSNFGMELLDNMI